MAQRGTIFLDEIGEMPLALQAKMLRAIETKRIERLGGNAPITVDVRIVAATNRLLRQAVAARQFREDLYFRLSVFPVTVPPLRERKEDIPKLAHHFVERVATRCRQEGDAVAGGAGDAGRAFLARQRARAAERDRARGDSRRRRAPAAASSQPVAHAGRGGRGDPWD